MRGLIFLLVLLSGAAEADLGLLLELQRGGDHGAYISSGFYDWRTVSKYRSQAGLHYGYDIAMLAGSPVRPAWAGEVVAITHWYGTEYGVTVRSGEVETTYGHINPAVELGQRVSSKTVLGIVVVDHVDVKMRGGDGRYIDFKLEPLPAMETALPEPSPEQPDPDLLEQLERQEFRLSMGWASRREVEELRSLVKGRPVLATAPTREPQSRKRRRTDALVLGSLVERELNDVDGSR